ncbi:uncharacterized protein LOC135924631 [Gordionus sp. m RMFG-2023]|uniref:uncharacterized protein LOC135924631 n=1 Tax=Gordionus sp. m RMFG-2023 TaxID=3053472 RepID=UPI0031FDE365
MQFGFTSGKGTTDAIFVVRQIQEKYPKEKKLYYAFVDLEKAFDRVPREITRWALRKSGVEEWLVTAVMAMYVGAQTAVRTDHGDSDSFEVKVGLHQGSVLSPLLFILVMDVVAREMREGLPWEILYADDLVLMANSEGELRDKVSKWKMTMKAKGLKMNASKTKVMIGGENLKIEESGKWPCGVCGKGVARNSIQCTRCQKWVHKRCSGKKGSLMLERMTFICKTCMKGIHNNDNLKNGGLDIGNGLTLEKVDKFCYLGDMLNADGGVDSAVVARIRQAWKKFREMSSILTNKKVSLKLKGKVYVNCVRSCLVYGGETWAMKAIHEAKLERTEMRMVRWMCGVSLRERKTSKELRARLGIEMIGMVMRRNRLRWFGHVERMTRDDWVKRCTMMEVGGSRPRGRPKMTWTNVIAADMRSLNLTSIDAQDRQKWKRKIRGKTGLPG